VSVEGVASEVGETCPNSTAAVAQWSFDADVAGGLEGGECLYRAESERPSRSRTNAKSTQSAEASRATIDGRVLGWISLSKRGSTITSL
jgi:hypothetical protein